MGCHLGLHPVEGRHTTAASVKGWMPQLAFWSSSFNKTLRDWRRRRFLPIAFHIEATAAFRSQDSGLSPTPSLHLNKVKTSRMEAVTSFQRPCCCSCEEVQEEIISAVALAFETVITASKLMHLPSSVRSSDVAEPPPLSCLTKKCSWSVLPGQIQIWDFKVV